MNGPFSYTTGIPETRQKFLQRLKSVRVHFWTWTIYIFFEVVSLGTHSGVYGHPLSYAQNYALHISFFYIHALFVMPQLRSGNLLNNVRFIFLLVMMLALYLFLNYQVNYGLLSFRHALNDTVEPFDFRYIVGRGWRFVFFMGCATGYFFLIKYLKKHQENLMLEREAMENELLKKDAEIMLAKATNAALKAQINPHFFSNVLNFVYNRTRKSDPELGDVILLLSKMMQYAVISELNTGKVSIGSEIEQVNNLISLWKLTRNDRIYIELEYDEAAGQITILPLVLLTLAENIFKHGDLSMAGNPAYMRVKLIEEDLIIETDNLLHEVYNREAGYSTGLENLRQRLDYEYGKRSSFEYGVVDSNRFKVKVQLKGNRANTKP